MRLNLKQNRKQNFKKKPANWSAEAWRSFCESQMEKFAAVKDWRKFHIWKRKLNEIIQPSLFEVEL